MRIDLSDRVAVVTGATGDLGRVMVRTLAECGADVAIHYHKNQAKGEELKAEIEAMGRRACPVQADVTDEASVRGMERQVTESLGHADIIVNNAVIQYAWKRALDQATEDYESQFRACVLHNLFMVKAFTPAMVEKGWGRVIGINTECSLQCWPNQSAYVSGKHGMNGLLRSLAAELGPSGITVNQVAPGWMLSDRDRTQDEPSQEVEEQTAKYSGMLPLRHRGQDQDIANAVAFLASDLARFITGVFLPVHGGGAVVPVWLQ